MENLVVLKQKPKLPAEWDYDKSVYRLKQQIYKWKNLTIEIATELSIAKEILSIPGSHKSSWSQYCKDIGSSRQVIDRWLNIYFPPVKKVTGEIPALPPGKFNVIYADPPWQYNNKITSWGPAELHYPTMTIEELSELDIPTTDDAVLFLWVTNPFLEDALKVVEAWGFEYKTNIVWVKRGLKRPGSGFYVRGRHELLFICTKGSFVPNQIGKSPIGSVIEADVEEHSKKPDVVYKVIEKMYPEGKYLELFAREQRDGWQPWGNEVRCRIRNSSVGP